jgi:hypothetical protein
MVMPGPQRISGEAFALERLRADPNLDFATLRREANAAGVSMQPIQYGRARKQLGLPPMQKPPAVRMSESPAAPSADAADADPPGEPPADDASDEPADRGAGEPAAAANDLVTPKRKGSAAFDFLVQELRRDPNLVYGDLRQRCEARGWKIAPIMYGRAKAVLGLVPVKPRGHAKKAAAAAAAAVPRTLKQVESVAADRFSKQLEDVRSLEQLIAVVKELDSERRRLRTLLDRIVTMIDEALG